LIERFGYAVALSMATDITDAVGAGSAF